MATTVGPCWDPSGSPISATSPNAAGTTIAGGFWGRVDSDIATSVIETISEPVPSPAMVQCDPGHHPAYWSGPEYCGKEDEIEQQREPDSCKPVASIGGYCWRRNSANFRCGIARSCAWESKIHGWRGGFRPAAAISPGCAERRRTVRGPGLGLPNYHAVVSNQHNENFRAHLPFHAYDVIVDLNIAGFACCRRHLETLLRTYASLLSPEGSLITARQGIDRAADGDFWKLMIRSVELSKFHTGLRATTTGYGVYILKRQENPARTRYK